MAPTALSTSSEGSSSPTPSYFTPSDTLPPSLQNNASPIQHQSPIAIIGMSCRLPGSITTPQALWELCSRARTTYTPHPPPARFSHAAFHHPDPGHPGTYHSQGGSFLASDPTAFDAPFFSLTEAEARAMDPQQRLLLECTVEALDSAAQPRHALAGQPVGVFVGGSLSEYETHLSRDTEGGPLLHQATGCAAGMQANRLSHFFDWRGPSVTLDTACSSSLVALHAACTSLRTGECSVAVTGACHLNLAPDSFIAFSTGRLLSDSGRSIAFDARGTGFGRGEGCGMLVLKPLERAVADGDAIRAVIRGTGVNQDGKTAGITTPNGEAQEALIRQVYAAAGADRADCGFVEAHGTGTKIGDPTEAAAIHAAALGGGQQSLLIGSIKANIGHLEAAAGVAAVIKAALMLERGFILPNHDFKTPNPAIPWAEWRLAVPKAQRPWPRNKKYVSVNSFGFGGTNAHAVLEKAPFIAAKKSSSSSSSSSSAAARKRLFVLSANDKKSLEAVMANLVVYLEQRPEIFQSDLLQQLAHTLSRRSLLKYRLALPATTSFELIDSLNNPRTLLLSTKPSSSSSLSSSLAFLFTGQGAQWHAMGRELYRCDPVYTASLNRADDCLHSLGATWSLVSELVNATAESSNINAAHVSQPACTAVQLALVDTLRAWGIRPTAVAGHSSGEIAAAYAAGVLGFDAAMAIAYHRGRMIPLLKKQFGPSLKGGMMAVGASRDVMLPILDAVNNNNNNATLAGGKKTVRIACYNSPSSLTISGDLAALDELERVIRETEPDMFHRRLQVDVAYHSHHMDLVAVEYRNALAAVLPPQMASSGVSFYSSLHGRLIKGSECDADYWVDNLTHPVRFTEALESLLAAHQQQQQQQQLLLVEIGPHSALQGPIKQTLQQATTTTNSPTTAASSYTSALVRKRSALDTLLDVAATVIAHGGMVNMDAVNGLTHTTTKGASLLLTDLPRYAWNHSTRYWHDSRLSRMHLHRNGGRRGDLVGIEATYSTDAERVWRRVFVLDDVPWVRHHLVQGLTVFPLGGFVAMAVEAVVLRDDDHGEKLKTNGGGVELRDVEVLKPLAFPSAVVEGNSSVEMSIALRRRCDAVTKDEWCEFRISSWSADSQWTEHCVGLVRTTTPPEAVTAVMHKPLMDDATRATEAVVETSTEGITAMYDTLSKDLGVAYGPSFRNIKSCKVAADRGLAVGTISPASSSALHATALESIMDMYWPILQSTTTANNTVYLASSIRHMAIHLSGAGADSGRLRAFCTATFDRANPRPTSVDIVAVNDSHQLAICSIQGLTVSPILDSTTSATAGDTPHRQLCYKLEWEPVEPLNASTSLPKNIALLHGPSNTASHTLATSLATALHTATSIHPTQIEDFFSSSNHNPTQLQDKTAIVLTDLDDDASFLASPTPSQFASLQSLTQSAQRILWVTRASSSPHTHLISGLSRTVRSETAMPFAHLHIDGDDDEHPPKMVDIILDVLQRDADMEFSYRGNQLSVPRVVEDEKLEAVVEQTLDPAAVVQQGFANATAGGRVLRMERRSGCEGKAVFTDDEDGAELAADEIEFAVHAIGVTRHDATSSLMMTEAGLQAAGVVTKVGSAVTSNMLPGTRIACLTSAMTATGPGAYATLARTTNAMKLPDTVSFADAAALSLPYTTAQYALVEQARLEAGQRVLVTCPLDPAGQAALCLASHHGAEVFAIARSQEEATAIAAQTPNVQVVLVFNNLVSKGTHSAIMQATKDQGVDVVFDMTTTSISPQDVQLRDFWTRCLAPFGCLVRVEEARGPQVTTKQQHRQHPINEVDLSSDLRDIPLPRNTSCLTVDMLALGRHRPRTLQSAFTNVGQLFQTGRLQPIAPIETLPFSRTHEALTPQAITDPKQYVVVAQPNDLILAPPRPTTTATILKQDATYIIVGGTGGLGRSIARWMASHGAGHILLLSRSGGTKTPAVQALQSEATNTRIHVQACDVSDQASVASLLSWHASQKLPAVAGLVHSAMVLHDVLFEKMSHAQYTAVLASKVHGAWNLHRAFSSGSTPPLDFFIAISSVSAIVGNRGQAAYAAANTFLDALVHHRRAAGLAATSLALAAVSDAGYLVEDQERAAEVLRNLGGGSNGSNTICEKEVLALVRAAVLGEAGPHVITGVGLNGGGGKTLPFWAEDAKFCRLDRGTILDEDAGGDEAGDGGATDLTPSLTQAEAEDVVCRGLVVKIAEVLMMEQEELDVTRTLSHYPLDSLVAIEIRNFIARKYEASMQVLELLSSGSIQTLSGAVCRKSKLWQVG